MTTLEDQLKIEVLKAVRQRIESKQSHYICVALAMIRASPTCSESFRQASIALAFYVARMLEGHAKLEERAWNHVYGKGALKYLYPSASEMRECRLQWIDWMIEQLRNP